MDTPGAILQYFWVCLRLTWLSKNCCALIVTNMWLCLYLSICCLEKSVTRAPDWSPSHLMILLESSMGFSFSYCRCCEVLCLSRCQTSDVSTWCHTPVECSSPSVVTAVSPSIISNIRRLLYVRPCWQASTSLIRRSVHHDNPGIVMGQCMNFDVVRSDQTEWRQCFQIPTEVFWARSLWDEFSPQSLVP
jgi:hypothetical protein